MARFGMEFHIGVPYWRFDAKLSYVMMPDMKTTLTIDDRIAKALKDAAHRTGKSYMKVANETLRAGLSVNTITNETKPYRLKPVSMGDVAPGYNLTKALELAEQLEDAAGAPAT